MKNRQIFLSGNLDKVEISFYDITIQLHNVIKGPLTLGNIPNHGRLEVIVPFYQRTQTGDFLISDRFVILRGHAQEYSHNPTTEVATLVFRLDEREPLDYVGHLGFVEIIVPLDQRLKEPKNTMWCTDKYEGVHLINKHKVLASVKIEGTWTLRVGDGQRGEQADTLEAGKKAVIEALAISGLEGYKYEDP